MRLSAWLSVLLLAACGEDNTGGLGDSGVQPPCTSNDQCPADQWCSGGACIPGSGNDCTSNDQCGMGQICEIVTDCGATRCSGNRCVPKPCTDGSECGGWLCVGGVCTDPPACSDQMPCPAPYVCNEGICGEGSGCADDGECEDGQLCLGGVCTPSTECNTSAECPSDLRCIRNLCREPCTSAEDCGEPAQLFSCDQQSGECQQRCFNNGQCPEGQFCEGGLCNPAECTNDRDCPENEACEGADEGRGRCEPFTPCDANTPCPTGSACDLKTGRCEALPACRTDRDCSGNAYCDNGFCVPTETCGNMSCPDGFDCVADVCVPSVCRSDADCAANERCLGGVCSVPPAPSFVTEVRIVTPAGYVRPGTTYTFVALALDQAGRVVPGVSFNWTSTSTSVAQISGTGVATGGSRAGVTEIRAAITTSQGPVTSMPVSLTNLGPTNGVRVIVVRAANGSPVSGASVEFLDGNTPRSLTTDAAGQAVFTPAAATYSVTAAHVDHDYVSVLGASARDILLVLPPLSRGDRVAGARGTVDLSRVTSSGELSLSLSGSSWTSPLLTFDAAQLFGGDIFTTQIPMLGEVPIPGGNTIAVEFMGFPFTLKDTYYARATPGVRAVWSFGGKVGLQGFGGGGGGFGNIIAALLPFFQRFEHTVQPAVNLVALPTIVDTGDIDGDGNTTENVPDWNAFPNQSLRPDRAQTLRYQLSVDNLPFVSGGNANTLIVQSGVVLPGVGFVPLGLDGQSDEQGSGIVSSFVTKMAPPHGGLEAGVYAVVASAVRVSGGGPGGAGVLPGPGSSRILLSDRLPSAVDLSDGWLDSPLEATWAANSRTVGLPTVAGADLYRIRLGGSDGAWHVYAAPPASGSLLIPAPPAGLVDRATNAEVLVDAVDLTTGSDPATIFDATQGGALGLDRRTRGFSRAVIAP